MVLKKVKRLNNYFEYVSFVLKNQLMLLQINPDGSHLKINDGLQTFPFLIHRHLSTPQFDGALNNL